MAGDATYANCLFSLHCDGANGSTVFADSSRYARTVNVVGPVISTAQSVFGGASGFFDGSNDYLWIPNAPEFAVGTNGAAGYCFRARVRFTAQPVAGTGASSIRMVFAKRQNDATRVFLGYADFTSVTSGPGLWFQLNFGGQSAQIVYNIALSLNTWYAVAVTWDGTDYRLFLDGALVGTATSSAVIGDIVESYVIGAGWSGSFVLAGYIEEIQAFDIPVYTAAYAVEGAAMLDYASQVGGVIYDDVGAPCARVVRVYDRASGALIGSQTSDVTTGEYLINCPTFDEVFRVVHDDSSGTLYNDLIDRVIPA